MPCIPTDIIIPPCPTVKEIAYQSADINGQEYASLGHRGRIVLTITGNKVRGYDMFRDNCKSETSNKIAKAVQDYLNKGTQI